MSLQPGAFWGPLAFKACVGLLPIFQRMEEASHGGFELTVLSCSSEKPRALWRWRVSFGVLRGAGLNWLQHLSPTLEILEHLGHQTLTCRRRGDSFWGQTVRKTVPFPPPLLGSSDSSDELIDSFAMSQENSFSGSCL